MKSYKMLFGFIFFIGLMASIFHLERQKTIIKSHEKKISKSKSIINKKKIRRIKEVNLFDEDPTLAELNSVTPFDSENLEDLYKKIKPKYLKNPRLFKKQLLSKMKKTRAMNYERLLFLLEALHYFTKDSFAFTAKHLSYLSSRKYNNLIQSKSIEFLSEEYDNYSLSQKRKITKIVKRMVRRNRNFELVHIGVNFLVTRVNVPRKEIGRLISHRSEAVFSYYKKS